MGYLDGSKEARAIVDGWLGKDGILSIVTKLNELGRAMFSNVAPVAPGAVLSALETALADADEGTLRNCSHFIRPLRSLVVDETGKAQVHLSKSDHPTPHGVVVGFGTFDYVYHSGYRRTQETAEHLLAAYTEEERKSMLRRPG